MNNFKKIILLIISIMITIILMNNLPNKIYADTALNANYRKIANIAVLLSSFDDPFLIQLKQNLQDIENENKDTVRFTFYDGKNNISTQYESLDSILKGNVDLIMATLANVNESTVENVLLAVKQKNVPLILWNVEPKTVAKVSKYYSKAAFILPDSKQAGTSQAKILVDLWNADKNTLDKNGDNILQYVLLKGEVNNSVAIDRTKYVISSINDSGIKTQQLALINANWVKEIAKDSISNLFLKYNGNIEAIISNNDAMAIGAIEALQKYGYNKGDKSKNIAVVGIDGLPEATDLIDKGFMTGTIIQDPKVAAKQAYIVGMNLINNLNPIENTNYKIVDGEIITPYPYNEYVQKQESVTSP